jgi:hypothetical protein
MCPKGTDEHRAHVGWGACSGGVQAAKPARRAFVLALPPTRFDTLLAFEPLSFWSGLNHALGLTPAVNAACKASLRLRSTRRQHHRCFAQHYLTCRCTCQQHTADVRDEHQQQLHLALVLLRPYAAWRCT